MESEAPRRGRPPREAVQQEERRRRQPGSLNRMVMSALSIPEEFKDPDYRYFWANDVRGRVQALTTQDDYDVVTVDELEATGKRNRADMGSFNRGGFDGSGNNVSTVVERDGTRAVLLKKRLTFYQADYESGLEARQAMMEGRVYEGDTSDDEKGISPAESYVPKGNSLPPLRRKGPVTTKRL